MPDLPGSDRDDHVEFRFRGMRVRALSSGALQLPDLDLVAVADLHLGKSQRIARNGGSLLPPYESSDSLARLQVDLAATRPSIVVCLGDSFDDDAAALDVSRLHGERLSELQGNCRWIWVCGNHDAEPDVASGEVVMEFGIGGLMFRHVATTDGVGEVSGHYHPKISLSAKGRRISRACFLIDRNRILLPAYGTYTGGLDCREPPLSSLMRRDAVAVMTGGTARMVPLPSGHTDR